jgi:deoxyribodipyrimidine photolyase-related protein
MVEKYFAEHPGTTDDWHYAVTREDAQLAAADFFDHRLDEFGPHQDAMLHGKPFLNHSVLSPYVNVCLLHPLELCREAESRLLRNEAQLASVEGFVRQLIGWREFVWRVYWRMMPEMKSKNGLNATEPLPDFFWTGDTRMRCLKDAIDTTIQHGYAHHIVRLMLLGNFALVAGLDPLETNNWFASMYIDGYDWVMVPNVIGMSLHADGGYVGTKPYAASANYINKMSDYCRKCPYDPKSATGDDACPFNALYWDFLMRNEETFAQNHRMSMIMKGLSAKSGDWRYGISNKADQLRESGWK